MILKQLFQQFSGGYKVLHLNKNTEKVGVA